MFSSTCVRSFTLNSRSGSQIVSSIKWQGWSASTGCTPTTVALRMTGHLDLERQLETAKWRDFDAIKMATEPEPPDTDVHDARSIQLGLNEPAGYLKLERSDPPPELPENRENNREFCEFRTFLRLIVSQESERSCWAYRRS